MLYSSGIDERTEDPLAQLRGGPHDAHQNTKPPGPLGRARSDSRNDHRPGERPATDGGAEHRSCSGSRRDWDRRRDTGGALSPQGPSRPTARLRDSGRRAGRLRDRARGVEHRAREGQLGVRQLARRARVARADRRDPRLAARARGQRKVPLAHPRAGKPWFPVMTRPAKATHDVAENGTARTAARALPKPAAMKFVVFEDNAGGYHWTIVTATGETLVQSASFASYEEAKQAARVVHGGAPSASLEPLARDVPPVELVAGGTPRTARDDLDAERWLDEGGSFSSQAVRR